jgi:hypothetical protein
MDNGLLTQMSGLIQPEDAFAVALYLRGSPNLEYWEDGRRASMCDVRAGESCFYDLKREPRGLVCTENLSSGVVVVKPAKDGV